MPEFNEFLKQGRPFVRTDNDLVSLHFEVDCVQSKMSCKNPFQLELPYTRTMMGFLLAKPDPIHVLMIGLGGGSLAKFCHKHLVNTRLTVVEINPDVIALRHLFKVPDDDKRFRVVCADGATFMRDAMPEFDVIQIDGFDAQGQAAQLSTKEFYEDCCRALLPKGLLVANLDSDHPAHTAFVHRISQTFKKNTIEIEVPDRNNRVIFAGKDLPLSSRWMSLSWTLGQRSVDAQTQLKEEFQRILGILDGRDPLGVGDAALDRRSLH
jgi:spermidine synthase